MSSTISSLSNVCPLTTNNFYLIELLRVSIILWCLLLLLVSLSVFSLLDVLSKKKSDISFAKRIDEAKRSLEKRIKAGTVQLLLLGFSSISSLSLDAVHCINIKDMGLFLYKQATSVECYQPWQIVVFVFIGGWIVLFPFTLYIGTLMLAWKRISSNWF